MKHNNNENKQSRIARLDSRLTTTKTKNIGEKMSKKRAAPREEEEQQQGRGNIAQKSAAKTSSKLTNEDETSWVYSSSPFAEEEGKNNKNNSGRMEESLDIIRDLFERNERDIGRTEVLMKTKLPEKKMLMLESSNNNNTNNRFREDREGDLHRKEERRRRFANAESAEYSGRGWKKMVRAKMGGDGLFGNGKEKTNALTWESLRRVRKLWREYAAKELEERRKEKKAKKTTTMDEHVDGISMRDGKEKDAWELFGAVVLVTKHRKASLVGESGVVVRETKTNVHVLRKTTTDASSLVVIPKTSGAELTISVSAAAESNEERDVCISF